MNERELYCIKNNRLVKEYEKMTPDEFAALKRKILSCFDSKDMRDYLDEHFLELHDSDLIKIIIGVQRSMEFKAELMNELAKRFPYPSNEDEDMYDFYAFEPYAKQYQDGFTDMQIGEDEQTVYLLRCYLNDEEDDSTPHFTFEGALKYIKEYVEPWRKDDIPEDFMTFIIEKWIKDDSGKSIQKGTYTLSANCEMWDYGYDDNLFHEFGLDNALGLNLPVPFSVGDIVTLDCRPAAPLSHCVILGIGDNLDCCSVQGLYVKEDGTIDFGALKHSHAQEYEGQVSPLYKAERFYGELPEEEAFMSELSAELVKWCEKNPEKYEYEYFDFIWSARSEGYTPQELIEKIKNRTQEL